MIQKIIQISSKYKIIRGMVAYGMLWPCGSLAEQSLIEHKTFKNYDWMKCLKFSLYGGFFMGPTLFVWMRLAAAMWPRTDIKSSLCKAITEQVSYDPMAITAFLYGMSLMEGRTQEEAKREVRTKFLDTYRVGVVYWPCVQTVNFTFIPIRNQVVFTSVFSMIWTTFLAYMKSLDLPNVDLDHHIIDFHFHID